ncbi:MAG: TerC family protein [Chloroflexota bacterium]|nr:TerC family protein [Chloroflexota bacterium]
MPGSLVGGGVLLDQIQAIIAIVLIDLALSGDNALLIGMAARQLPDDQRRIAIVVGGTLAVALRIAGTAVVSLLLAIPYLQLIGGIALAVIAYRLVAHEAGGHDVRPAGSLRGAIITILVADAVMSLENVLGVAGAAHGDIPILAFGLALSIPIVLFGSGLVAGIIDRYPRAIWLGAAALAWTAVDLGFADPTVARLVPDHLAIEIAATAVLLAIIYAAHRVGRSTAGAPT